MATKNKVIPAYKIAMRITFVAEFRPSNTTSQDNELGVILDGIQEIKDVITGYGELKETNVEFIVSK